MGFLLYSSLFQHVAALCQSEQGIRSHGNKGLVCLRVECRLQKLFIWKLCSGTQAHAYCVVLGDSVLTVRQLRDLSCSVRRKRSAPYSPDTGVGRDWPKSSLCSLSALVRDCQGSRRLCTFRIRVLRGLVGGVGKATWLAIRAQPRVPRTLGFLTWAALPPVLKRGRLSVSSPAPDSYPTTGKVVAKHSDLRGGQRRKRSDVGRTGLKTHTLTTSPQPAVVLWRKRQANPRAHYSQAKNTGKGKRGARRGMPQRAAVQPQRSGRVTFSLSTIGNFDSSTSIGDEVDEPPASPVVFRPELVTAHCFRRLKKKDFHLPQSRRRIIIVRGTKDQAPVNPMLPPQKPPSPIPTFKTLQIEDIQQPPLDQKAWLSQRAKLRQELESFGDVKRWLENKPSITPSEAKVLNMIHQEQKPHKDNLTMTRVVCKSKVSPPLRYPLPKLQLPRPKALWDMYSYLRSRKIKILEIFNKMELGDNQQIPREEFILALKAVGVPLKNQELEDIVIYLSSLGRKNAISTDALAGTHKQWLLSQQRSSVFSAKELFMDEAESFPRSPPKKQQPKELAPQLPKKDLLQVPEVDMMESRPMTLEDMEDVGRRYRERRRQHKLPLSSIHYMESCRMVHCGNKYYDDHCLPSTLQGEMQVLVNLTRRDTFLVYLRCRELCEAFGLPLTEYILMRALLYPGDKLISVKDEIRPIRQPGGYYVDEKLVHILPGLDIQMRQKLEARKTEKKTSKKLKKMDFKEFEEFAGMLKENKLIGQQHAHPNYFWPGHLLDKLRLYLPNVASDRSLALFSCVQQTRHAYPAIYHSNHWWPMKDGAYMTRAYYDATKVYSLN